MKDSTKMMRLAMEDLKQKLTDCKRKNAPFLYDGDQDLMKKIQSIGDTIAFFDRQKESMERLVTTTAHRAYINKIASWIKDLDDLRYECISELNDRRSAQGGD